jgi:hypothetical protein
MLCNAIQGFTTPSPDAARERYVVAGHGAAWLGMAARGNARRGNPIQGSQHPVPDAARKRYVAAGPSVAM